MKILIRETVKDVDVVSVTILENRSDNYKMWNCPTCKNPVFQYKGDVISITPGETLVEIPIIIQCSNSNCRQKYLLKTVVSREVFV